MANYPSRVIENSYGKALVATRDLPAGTIVQQFRGDVIPYSEVPPEKKNYVICVGDKQEDKWIASDTDAIRANHSCDPNCRIDDSLNLVTIRNVRQNEELTFSYNLLDENEDDPEYFWDNTWNFECKCGAVNCQGYINRYVSLEKVL